jgi:hypothetical protein
MFVHRCERFVHDGAGDVSAPDVFKRAALVGKVDANAAGYSNEWVRGITENNDFRSDSAVLRYRAARCNVV